MIADAGYPSGFNCVLNITGNSADLAQACVDMWTKIGIKATIQINDQATDASISQNMTFTDIIATSGGTMVDPIITMRMIIGNPGMMYAVGDPLGFDAQQSAIGATIDAATRTTLEQKLGLAIEDDVPFLPFAMANSLDCYWSWVKNYYGEVDTGWFNQQPIINRIWIDQNLKKSLGK
jgi:ABC-type transport system substrate-binding protein